jgi:hypothetical protein
MIKIKKRPKISIGDSVKPCWSKRFFKVVKIVDYSVTEKMYQYGRIGSNVLASEITAIRKGDKVLEITR